LAIYTASSCCVHTKLKSKYFFSNKMKKYSYNLTPFYKLAVRLINPRKEQSAAIW